MQFTSSHDPRLQELLDLAREEGIVLPMPVDMIVWFEQCGKLVDLVTGTVYDTVAVQPTRHAQAVSHLLSQVEGAVVI